MIKLKKRVAAILIGILAITPFQSTELYNLRQVNAAATTTNFSTSYYTEANITIKTEENAFVFTDLPNDSKFSKVRVSLYRIKEGSTAGETINRQDSSGTTPVRYDLSKIDNGSYYIQLYYLVGKTYKSYWFQKGGPVLVKSNEGVSIHYADPYERNLLTFQTRASGADALEYYLKPDLIVDSDNAAVIAKAQEITKGITDDYKKVIAVHDWVSNNIWYDQEYLQGRTTQTERIASDVLSSKKSVCQGYANLAAGMLRAIGIPSKVTNGYALAVGTTEAWSDAILDGDTINHAWNEAYVDGRWIMFDCTWDSNNEYNYYPYQKDSSGKLVKTKVSNPWSESTGLTGYQNFDPTLDAFSATHYIMDQEKSLFTYLKKIYKNKESLEVDGATKLSIWSTAPDLNDVSVEYTIDNSEIATVDKNGMVKGLSEGTTTITATVSLGKNSNLYETTVTITNPDPTSEDTTETDTEENLTDNKDEQLTDSVQPSTSPDDTLASGGQEEIIVPEETAAPEEENDIETLLNNVRPSLEEVQLYCGGNLNTTERILYYGVTDELRGKIKLAYAITNPNIASISSNGTITAKKAGTTKLTIRYEADGYIKEDYIAIKVKKATITLSPTIKKLKKGKTATLSTKLTGVSGTVKWKSSNKKIATVSSKGKVKGKKKGTATITAYIGTVKSSVKIKIY